ncbi:uncharacterized protein [Montipora capricornis]|uniref:uncharacterized protein n=1 Tax=Montipora capricornis TaxID=246305 RepID=UPI0035F15E60
MTLRGHVFQEINTADILTWGQLCNSNIRCQSLDYVMSRSLCGLNSRTREARPDDYVKDSERIYVTRPSERVPLGLIQEVPAESCSEIKASEGHSVISGNYWHDSIKCRLERIDGSFLYLECHDYQVLSNADRKTTNGASPRHCDNALGPAWFRFQGNAGTRIPNWCVPRNRCGTHATGWLNGTHPLEHEGNVTRTVCFKWNSNCCNWSVNIQVRNCSGYYLYYSSGTYSSHPCRSTD